MCLISIFNIKKREACSSFSRKFDITDYTNTSANIGITSQLMHSFYSSNQHLNASTEIQKQFQFSLLRPLVPNKTSTGILTCFPSTT